MSTATADSLEISLADPAFLRRANALRAVNNHRNWIYLIREYAFLALVLGGAIWLLEVILRRDVHWAWAIPALVVANLCLVAGRHRLATLTHEVAHYMLFQNRLPTSSSASGGEPPIHPTVLDLMSH